jgi:predicted O-linked N-acetylglucosamine transferase (SPINDLY family)
MSSPSAPDPQLEQALQEATGHHLAGRLGQAEAGYRELLERCPGHATALHRLGILTLQTGQAEASLELFNQAIAADPDAWRSLCGLGQALAALGRNPEALAAFRRSAAVNPACLEAHLGAGAACRALGLGREAIEAFTRAVELRPDHAEAHNNLGAAQRDAGRLPEAIAAFRRALERQEDDPVAHSNLGEALLADQQVAAALDQLERTVARWPDAADAWYNLGNAASRGCAFERAEAAFRRCLALAPGHLAALNNLGNVLQALGRHEEALATHLEALRIDPGFISGYNNASASARALGRMDLAVSLLRDALAVAPGFPVIHCNLGNLLKDIGLMDEAIGCFRRTLELDPGDRVTQSNLAYAVTFQPGIDPAGILAENRAWDRAQAQGLPAWPVHRNDPDPGRRLRIGYVSPDFREHCQSLFTLPLLSHHDHGRFEIICYARVPKPDAITRRIMGYADGWRDTAALDDAQVADLVAADRIDILVDLTMHMANGRPLLFARKPAPVQAAWLAYPGTTGLRAMDYRVSDAYLDPPGEHDDWYSETTVRLPDTFWCYDPLTAEPQPGPLPALANGVVTFGSLNNFCKVNDSVLDLWARVLVAVAGSRLLLLCQPGAHRQRVLDRLQRGGVEPGRVEFAEFRPRPEYLALYRRVDLGLDTFPYNGHTTSLDAFWMGVPMVTRVGGTVVGRAGWSQLCNLGLRQLAAETDDAFVEIAAGLARDLPALAALRSGLRARMEASPLMDGERFTRNLESSLRWMWRQWCLGHAGRG